MHTTYIRLSFLSLRNNAAYIMYCVLYTAVNKDMNHFKHMFNINAHFLSPPVARTELNDKQAWRNIAVHLYLCLAFDKHIISSMQFYIQRVYISGRTKVFLSSFPFLMQVIWRLAVWGGGIALSIKSSTTFVIYFSAKGQPGTATKRSITQR